MQSSRLRRIERERAGCFSLIVLLLSCIVAIFCASSSRCHGTMMAYSIVLGHLNAPFSRGNNRNFQEMSIGIHDFEILLHLFFYQYVICFSIA